MNEKTTSMKWTTQGTEAHRYVRVNPMNREILGVDNEKINCRLYSFGGERRFIMNTQMCLFDILES